MKKLILLFTCLSFFQLTRAQVQVSVHMNQTLGNQPFVYNTSVQKPGYYFKVNRLQYYISEIRLIHDGGQITPVTDLYFLVSPSRDSIFSLGTFAITDLEKIEFSVGVDQAHNHLDPASYPAAHPLAPKNPTMHWGWTAGYRFIAFEGYSGTNGVNFPDNYQIHTIDDSNYRTLSLDVEEQVNGDKMVVPVKADYTRLLDGINIVGGLISHSANGPSKTIIDNMRDHVFTGAQASGITDREAIPALRFIANPVQNIVRFTFGSPGDPDMTFWLADLAGRTVHQERLSHEGTDHEVYVAVLPGLYLASVRSGSRILATGKLLVTE